MKAPHLLRVEDPPAAYASLLTAVREAGLRVGWLDLGSPAPLPGDLESAAGLGVLRAVAVGEGRSVAVKPRSGPPVLRDLLREHFLGCSLVLVRGVVEVPDLAAEGAGWRVSPPGEAPRRLTTEALVARLRRPRPW